MRSALKGAGMSDTTTDEGLREQIRDHYAERAVAAGQTQPRSCGCSCGPSAPVAPQDEFARGLYAVDETSDLPAEAVLASLGCGNPTALAELAEGEVVLDLGSGGGIDVLLSARRVGPSGKAYGLDMTDEMLALARANQRKPGGRFAVSDVLFQGDMTRVPRSLLADVEAWSGCVAGALEEQDFLARLRRT